MSYLGTQSESEPGTTTNLDHECLGVDWAHKKIFHHGHPRLMIMAVDNRNDEHVVWNTGMAYIGTQSELRPGTTTNLDHECL